MRAFLFFWIFVLFFKFCFFDFELYDSCNQNENSANLNVSLDLMGIGCNGWSAKLASFNSFHSFSTSNLIIRFFANIFCFFLTMPIECNIFYFSFEIHIKSSQITFQIPNFLLRISI